jgi:hypothetical protein
VFWVVRLGAEGAEEAARSNAFPHFFPSPTTTHLYHFGRLGLHEAQRGRLVKQTGLGGVVRGARGGRVAAVFQGRRRGRRARGDGAWRRSEAVASDGRGGGGGDACAAAGARGWRPAMWPDGRVWPHIIGKMEGNKSEKRENALRRPSLSLSSEKPLSRSSKNLHSPRPRAPPQHTHHTRVPSLSSDTHTHTAAKSAKKKTGLTLRTLSPPHCSISAAHERWRARNPGTADGGAALRGHAPFNPLSLSHTHTH